MGRLYKRKGVYYADLRAEGGGRISLHTANKAVARERLANAELDQTRGASAAPKPLGVAIDDMIALKRAATAQQYRAKGLHLCRVLGAATDINSLNAAMVADYCAKRLEEKACRHTIHKELVVLRQTLKNARKRGEYHGSLEIVPEWAAEYTPRKRYLTEAEYAKLMAVLPPQRRMWVALQCYASANLGEVSRMTWEHVDLKNGVINVPGTKRTSRDRRVPIPAELRLMLAAADKDKPLVAPWTRPNHDLRKFCEAAGIPRLSTNDLRRTFAARLKQRGVDSLVVAHLMGHSSPTMVNRVYGQLDWATYQAAMDKMPRARKSRHT